MYVVPGTTLSADRATTLELPAARATVRVDETAVVDVPPGRGLSDAPTGTEGSSTLPRLDTVTVT